MAVDYKRYLAENVLSEQRTVTYRLLSRALKIHCNLAKQILYEFYRTENAKSPGSLNATYLVAGIPVPDAVYNAATNGSKPTTQNGDVPMQSSPFMSSAPEPPASLEKPMRKSLYLLAREEDLKDAKARFESISTIYVYSVQPNPVPDLNSLTDVSREIWATYGKDDPLELGGTWGMIQNRHVKRRKGMGNAPLPPQATSVVSTKPFATKEEPPQPKSESENDSASSKPSSQQGFPRGPIKPGAKSASIKRQGSDLFASFAKAKTKQKTSEANTPMASGVDSAEPSGPEDIIFDEDGPSEDEREDLFLDTGERKTTVNHESKEEREAKLRKMMEDDDDELPDAPAPMDSVDEITPEPEKKAEPKEEVSVTGGRRRGRRQVMKKKTIKDEEGYLVTVEEPVWESFSEEEAPLPSKKKGTVGQQGATGKKGGQGNIMSFFSKK